MSINVTVSTNTKSIREFKKKISPDKLRQGMSVAINQTIREARKKAITAVGNTHHIPKKNLEEIEYHLSKPDTLSAHLSASKTPLPTRLFRSVQSQNNGVTMHIKKGQSSVLRYAFKIKGYSGVFARGVYRTRKPYGFIRSINHRKKNKDKVARILTMSISGAMNNPVNKDIITEYIETTLPKRMMAELRRRIAKQ